MEPVSLAFSKILMLELAYLGVDISISVKHVLTKFDKQEYLVELTQLRQVKQLLVMSSRQGHLTLKK